MAHAHEEVVASCGCGSGDNRKAAAVDPAIK